MQFFFQILFSNANFYPLKCKQMHFVPSMSLFCAINNYDAYLNIQRETINEWISGCSAKIQKLRTYYPLCILLYIIH